MSQLSNWCNWEKACLSCGGVKFLKTNWKELLGVFEMVDCWR